jgi:hypothetical protein
MHPVLFNAFSVGSNARPSPRVLPWAELGNAFGVKKSTLDTDSLSLESAGTETKPVRRTAEKSEDPIVMGFIQNDLR